MKKEERSGAVKRKTRETDITLTLNLDGEGKCDIRTGIGFFDHMLGALALHASLDLSLSVKGDLEVDGHHTVEDCGICLGMALKEAFGDRAGIARYGSMLLPMDEALARAALDIGGRAYLRYEAVFHGQRIGDYDTALTKEFFRALVNAAGMTLHLDLLEGENDHHSTEAMFKAFAHALRQAGAPGASGTGKSALSTKGTLA